MPRNAFILGGTGQIGRAIASKLLASGWDVSIASRGLRPLSQDRAKRRAKLVMLDRERPDGLARALGDGADALIDVTAYGLEHGYQLLEVQGSIGALVVISSSSVYCDDAGRTLDEAAQNGFPQFAGPIHESQQTVAPGDATYSTRKVALENLLLDKGTSPVTILRPAAIHGPGSTHPREWWFVKRILDGRLRIPLAYNGESRFHTSSVFNIAELTRIALEQPQTRILNIADPEALKVVSIGSSIARHMGYTGELVQVSDSAFPARIGRTPWSVPRPFILDNSAALAIGYEPVTTYAQSVGEICDELAAGETGSAWRDRFPVLASYPFDLFDYPAKDLFFSMASGADYGW